MDLEVVKLLSELEEHEASPLNKRFWSVPRSTGEFLNAMVGFLDAGNVLEIGTSNGYSGIWLAEALSRNNGRLFTVESHQERFDVAKKNFNRAGLDDYIVMVKGHAPEVFKDDAADVAVKWPDFFDMVFLDATKMEYLRYLDAILPFLRDGGLIIADNCLTHTEDLKDFVEEVHQNKQLKSFLLPVDNGLMLSFKAKRQD